MKEHFFYKGRNNILDNKPSYDEKVFEVRKEFSKILDIRNLTFLMGSGCSMGEFGIPTMKKFADVFFDSSDEEIKKMSDNQKKLLLKDSHKKTLKENNIDYLKQPFRDNLETFLGTLYSLKFYLNQINNSSAVKEIEEVILQTKRFILYKCLNEENSEKDEAIINVYKNFYRKLSLRDSNLPKANIVTTNYDLYSEKTLDQLGITYTNGFSGFVERYFNPSIFNYALAEQMDISSFKWNIIDNFIYLFKIHGSVNWLEVEETTKLFNVKEVQDVNYDKLKEENNIMIYPSPIKQNSSLGSPYSDLFREFQKRITQNESVLVTMGYSFSDEHINNLIYQALTIPTFRLVIFSDLKFNSEDGNVNERENIKKLLDLNDPRIWIIGTNILELDKNEEDVSTPESDKKSNIESSDVESFEENTSVEKSEEDGSTSESEEHTTAVEIKNKEFGSGEDPLHFFGTISGNLMPDWSENQIEDKNQNIINLLNKNKTPKQSDND